MSTDFIYDHHPYCNSFSGLLLRSSILVVITTIQKLELPHHHWKYLLQSCVYYYFTSGTFYSKSLSSKQRLFNCQVISIDSLVHQKFREALYHWLPQWKAYPHLCHWDARILSQTCQSQHWHHVSFESWMSFMST